MERCREFNASGDEAKALPYTTSISNLLIDHSKIDYKRTATVEERKVIYKAMMASVIVHNGLTPLDSLNFTHHNQFDQLYRKSSSAPEEHVGYNSHFNALRTIHNAIEFLWQGVQLDCPLSSLWDMPQPEKSLLDLTPNFVDWFKEVLESHKRGVSLQDKAFKACPANALPKIQAIKQSETPIGLVIGRCSQVGVDLGKITDPALKCVSNWFFADPDAARNTHEETGLVVAWPNADLAKNLQGLFDVVVFEIGVESHIGDDPRVKQGISYDAAVVTAAFNRGYKGEGYLL